MVAAGLFGRVEGVGSENINYVCDFINILMTPTPLGCGQLKHGATVARKRGRQRVFVSLGVGQAHSPLLPQPSCCRFRLRHQRIVR